MYFRRAFSASMACIFSSKLPVLAEAALRSSAGAGGGVAAALTSASCEAVRGVFTASGRALKASTVMLLALSHFSNSVIGDGPFELSEAEISAEVLPSAPSVRREISRRVDLVI